MKNLFKVLLFGIFAIIGIAMVSCEIEDITVTATDGINGQDGKDGRDGKDAENPVFTTEKEWISDLCWVRTIFLNGGFFYEDTLCNGQNGKDGKNFDPDDMVFSYEVIELDERCDIIIWYLNENPIFTFENCDGKDGEDGQDAEPYNPELNVEEHQITDFCKLRIIYLDDKELFRDTICNGEDSQSNIYIDIPDYQEEFNNPGNTGHYLDKGCEVSYGVSIDQEGSPYGNGTLYLEDVSIGSGWFRTPTFPKSAITALEIGVGSNELWEVDIYAQRSNGEWIPLKRNVIGGVPNFLWYDQSTYGETFTWYITSLEDINYQDFVRLEVNFWRVQDEKKGVKCETDRNSSFNMSYIRAARVIKSN